MLSVDYGTQNATAVLLWGLYGNVWYCIREYYYSGRETGKQKTDEEYCDDIENTFSDAIQKKQDKGEKIRIIVDPSAASFITALKRRKKYKVAAADNNVLDGIRDTDTAMFQEKIKIFDSCKCLIGELQGYCWIPNSPEDAPVKENDHACDSMRYFVETMKIVKPKYQRNIQIGAYL